MTENKISSNMIFFASIKDSIDALNLSDKLKVEYYEGIINYGLYGIDPKFSNATLTAIFIALKPNIDANNRKKQQAIICAENGKKGGRPRKSASTSKSAHSVNEKSKTKSHAKTIDIDREVDSDVDEEVEVDVEKETKDISFISSYSSKEKEQENGEKEFTTDDNCTPDNVANRCEDTDTPSAVPHPVNDLNTRNENFYQSLVPYVDTYGTDTIQQFYDYWSEPNATGTHMRYELEPTWNLDYRLERWMKKRKRLNL